MLARKIAEKLRKTRWLLNIGDDNMAEPIAIIAAELKPVREALAGMVSMDYKMSPDELNVRYAAGRAALALIDGEGQ